ncbi:MAG: kynureninase [Cytophagaceae bacterium]|nr:kynureninase [Cytophagaceae bacterium]
MTFYNSPSQAQQLDHEDPLKKFREKFHIPEINSQQSIYLSGHSLGLQPKSVKEFVQQELNDWAELGVEGHFSAKNPWVSYRRLLTDMTAGLVGAKPIEVTSMNSLTVNLNLLLISFYQPDKKRYKIITEANCFSSDIYALENHVKLHGLHPDKTIIELAPRRGEFVLRTEDILDTIEKHSRNLAMVFLGGIHYYTGQALDMKKISAAAHKAGAMVGFDLAHAAGNIELNLHDWKVDFASWCTYKYLNAGPGATGQIFVHEKFARAFELPRLAGWWGHNEKERFRMKKGFRPMAGAEGWAQSNDNVLSMASLKASLEIFHEAGMNRIAEKSKKLTGFLEFLLKEKTSGEKKYKIRIITPEKERGAQLSIYTRKNARELYDLLRKENFVVDYREPDVIRITPAPLYNTFEEVYKVGSFINQLCVDD